MSEQDLIAGCKKKDPRCQKLLFTTYAPKMLGVCRRYVDSLDTAEDILQDGFIKVFQKIDTYTGEGAFGGWIRRVFVTTALEHLRQNKAMQFNVSLDDINEIQADAGISVLSRLTVDDLMKCIAELPMGYRTIFNLYAIEGYSHKEIAEMLNIKENSSQSQLVRARKVLQEKVQSILNNDYVSQQAK